MDVKRGIVRERLDLNMRGKEVGRGWGGAWTLWMKPINQRPGRNYNKKDARGNESFLHAGVTAPNFVRLYIWQCEPTGNVAPGKFEYSILHIQH